MAKYHGMYEEGLRYLDACIIDLHNKEIRVIKPVTIIDLHRSLSDAFDEPDLMVETTPSMRYTDTICESLPPWIFLGVSDIKGTLRDWRYS